MSTEAATQDRTLHVDIGARLVVTVPDYLPATAANKVRRLLESAFPTVRCVVVKRAIPQGIRWLGEGWELEVSSADAP